MAGELGISTSAYSKIERGVTDPSIGRMGEIAKILEVDISYFFQDHTHPISKAEDHNKPYGFATKSDIEELTRLIGKMNQEIAVLKAGLPKPAVKKKKKA